MTLSDYNNRDYTFKNVENIKSGEWSVPTIETWLTIAGQLNIIGSNYSEYGLKQCYWSSSRFVGGQYISFKRLITNNTTNDTFDTMPVRLVRTF